MNRHDRPLPAGEHGSAVSIPAPDQSIRFRWAREGRWQAAMLILTAIAGFISWSPRLADFPGYLSVGGAVLAGADIYRDTPPGINTWPPFFSLICVPLALIGRISVYLATSLWLLLGFAVLLLLLDLLARLLYGQALTLRRQGPGLSITSAALLVPLILTSPYIFHNYEHAQINLSLLGLTLGGLYLLQTGRTAGGAVALGLAIAMKVMPVVFLPYLLYRRAWRAFLASSLAVVAFSLSPIAVFGWTRFVEYIGSWRHAVSAGWGVGVFNQSIYAMLDRFIGHHLYPFAPGRERIVILESGDPNVKLAWWITMGVIGLFTLRQFRVATPSSPRVVAAEWSVVLIISALAGPVAWKLYLVVLLVPNALLFAVWRRRDLEPHDRRVVGWVLSSSAFLAFLTAHSLIGNWLSTELELGSVATLSGLVMLGGVLWLRGRPALLAGPDASQATEAR